MAGIYLETSFISALMSDRIDAASVYRADTSREWWVTQAPRHDLYSSAAVVAELSDPRYPHSDAALARVADIPLLPVNTEVRGLAHILVRDRVMPGPVRGDAIHTAVATIHRIDFMLTWNVRHLANPNKLEHLTIVCVRLGLLPTRIVTPEQLWESPDDHA